MHSASILETVVRSPFLLARAMFLSLKGRRRTLKASLPSRYVSAEFANRRIRESIEDGTGFMAARFGHNELNAILEIERRQSLGRAGLMIDDIARGSAWATETNFAGLRNGAGFFPIDNEHLSRFHKRMVEDMSEVDLLASWIEGENYFQQKLASAQICDLRSLEPYYHAEPWTSSLRGKKVLVIHPFARTIERQYSQSRAKLFSNALVLPEFEISTMRAVQSIAGNKTEYSSWFEALDAMSTEIQRRTFDVALIGCGAYGFPLAAMVKRLGKQAINLGGATQILFGIKGTRWDTHPVISRLYNEYWVRPTKDETPSNASTVEGGCYW